MILTDDFVFIHEPKTGGTFVTEMLSSIYEPVTDHGVIKRVLRRMHRRGKKPVLNILKHGTCSEIPNSHRDKPILATIRNPYDLYVSQYEFAWWKVHPEDYCDVQELRKRYPHYPYLTFEEFIELNNTLFLRLKNDRFPPEACLGLQTEQFVRYFFKNPEKVFPAIDEEYIASRKYKADMLPVHFIHTDRLNQELCDFLVRLGGAFHGIDPFKNGDPPPMLSARIEAEKMNHSHDTPARNFFLTRTVSRVKKLLEKSCMCSVEMARTERIMFSLITLGALMVSFFVFVCAQARFPQ